MISLEEVKDYMRVDGADEDVLISSLIMASEEYIKNSSSTTVDTGSYLYRIACLMLVTHWYENRSIVGDNKTVPHFIDNIIIQLKYAGGGTL